MSTPTRFDFNTMLQHKSRLFAQQTRINRATRRGQCLFTLDDVRNTSNPIAKIFKYICIDRGITEEIFSEAHRKYFEMVGTLPTQINTDKHNLLRTIQKPTLTVKVLEKILTVLDFDIRDISYTLYHNPTGVIKTYRVSDADTLGATQPVDIVTGEDGLHHADIKDRCA